MSKRLILQGEIQKEENKDFTEEQRQLLIDEFIEFIESKGCVFIGSFKS